MGLILGWKGYIHSPKAKNKMLIILCVQSDRFCSQDILLKKKRVFQKCNGCNGFCIFGFCKLDNNCSTPFTTLYILQAIQRKRNAHKIKI